MRCFRLFREPAGRPCGLVSTPRGPWLPPPGRPRPPRRREGLSRRDIAAIQRTLITSHRSDRQALPAPRRKRGFCRWTRRTGESTLSRDGDMGTEPRIFISYRRSDCQSQANGLNDGLRHRLPDAQVFMDLDSIPPGADFEEHIRNEIDQCDVVLVLIGDEWLEPQRGTSTRRIDNPNDFVRLEVTSALRNDQVRVIPVLVEGAQMPQASQLPDDIARLARLNAYVLSDSHWARDITELTNHLGGMRSEAPQQSAPSVTFADIDVNALRTAVADLPRQFATKDVSTHAAMLAAHEDVAERSNYHTMVGRLLMKHRGELGLGSPEAPTDDRGSRWTRVSGSRATAATAPANPAPAMPTSPLVHSTQPKSGSSAVGKLMIVLPLISIGMLAFVPPLWAGIRLKHDASRQRKMYAFAGVLGAATLLGFILLGSGPVDADGTPTGPVSDTGGFLLLACMATGVVVAVRNRRPPQVLAGTAQELMKRDLRRQYRDLANRDASLAASMRIGRPDVERGYDDGGLVDLNSMPVEGLQRFAGLSHADAAEVVRARGELGRFSSVNELEAFTHLSHGALARLREIAVFV